MSQAKRPLKEKKENRDLGILLVVLALFLFIAAMFIEGERDAKERSALNVSQQSSHHKNLSPDELNKINQYMKESKIHEEIQEQSTEAENVAMPEVGYTDENVDGLSDDVNPISLSQDRSAEKVLKDTQEKKSRRHLKMTPDQRVSAKIERDAWSREYEQRQQDEYVKQFTDNARQHGVDVRLNKNLDVTGLQVSPVEEPIRVPQSVPHGAK